MQGSTVAQFLWTTYSQVAHQASVQVIGTILPIVSAATIVVLHLFIVIWGKNVAFNEMPPGEFANRFVRGYLVIALMVPATFNTYITTGLTQDIPDQITQAVGGQQNLQGAQGFDALLNQVSLFGSKVRAQMHPVILYLGERVTVWVAEMICKGLIAMSFFIWAIAQITVYFIVPLLALIGWLYLFRATQHIVESVLAKIVALFLIEALALIVAAVTVQTTGIWMQKYGDVVLAQAANPGLKIAGDNGQMLNFTGFGAGMIAAETGMLPTTNPVDRPDDQTINVDSSIETILSLIVVLLFGFALLAVTTRIAYSVGRAGGMNISGGVAAAAGRVAGAAGRFAGKAARR